MLKTQELSHIPNFLFGNNPIITSKLKLSLFSHDKVSPVPVWVASLPKSSKGSQGIMASVGAIRIIRLRKKRILRIPQRYLNLLFDRFWFPFFTFVNSGSWVPHPHPQKSTSKDGGFQSGLVTVNIWKL